MSTKCTIDHGPNNTYKPDQPEGVDYHLFYECLDYDNIYLEIVDPPFVQTKLSKWHGDKLVTTIAIPGKLWNHIVRLGELKPWGGEETFENPRSEEQRTKNLNDGVLQSIEMLEGMIKDREARKNDVSRSEE